MILIMSGNMEYDINITTVTCKAIPSYLSVDMSLQNALFSVLSCVYRVLEKRE